MPDHPGKTRLKWVAEQLLPDSTSMRMSRIFDVNQRTVQKWLAGQMEPPQRVIDWMNGEFEKFESGSTAEGDEDRPPTITQDLGAVIAKWSTGGNKLHEETIAAHFALVYKRMMNREIE